MWSLLTGADWLCDEIRLLRRPREHAAALITGRDRYPAKVVPVVIFCCPVCGAGLERDAQVLRCANGHAFDVARQGYVNLLLAQHRRSADPGYSQDMITSRHEFFAAGHYRRLADAIAEEIIAYLPEAGGPVKASGESRRRGGGSRPTRTRGSCSTRAAGKATTCAACGSA